MDKLTEKRIEVLNETIAFYGTDPSRRSVNGDTCLYQDPETMNCCAVGRLLDKELLEKLSLGRNKSSLSSIFHLLPKELQFLDVTFLKRLQFLHDVSRNWSADEDEYLTEAGISKIKYICRMVSIPLGRINVKPIADMI